tara:strand:- start:674 stop:937 length:264 start_codon:yes stop_codon:yes gene_type:complete
MIQKESQINFEMFLKAARNDDISLVSCKDAKGREFDVLAILCLDGEDLDNYVYLPFAVLATSNLYPLMNKIKPPENLKGAWCWDDED